jgi:hypothetical protein
MLLSKEVYTHTKHALLASVKDRGDGGRVAEVRHGRRMVSSTHTRTVRSVCEAAVWPCTNVV